MWRWLNTNEVAFDPGPTRELYPQATTVEAWLRRQKYNR
jgi:hypothetical protein